MADTGPASSEETGPSGRVRGFVQAGLRYLEVRGKLFQIEAQEAGTHVSKVGVRTVLSLGALLVAWLLAVPAGVSLGAELLKHRWPWMRWEYLALAVAALHLFIGFLLLVAARSQMRRMHLFEESLNQFKKDREWVAQNQQPPI